jgi:glyoxylase-like metal-dependent hydrolase (beta-lactamase superfamily II)
MCELHEVQRIGRRSWLTRSASGLLALWAGLDFGFGRQGWGVLLGGTPRAVAQAQPTDGDRVLPVEVELQAQGQSIPVSAFVLVRGNEAAIVDTLTAGNAERIGGVIQSAGLSWSAVRHVILTHYHPDHVGSVGDVSGLASQATIWAGPADIPQIPLNRPIQAAADGQEVFGLQIVATPGHTPGHLSVLDPRASSLFVGDAAFNIGGQLVDILLPQFTADADQARASIRKLGALGFERAWFAHGPPIERGAAAAFARLAPAAAAPAPAPAPAPASPPAPPPRPAPAQVPRQ